MAAINRKVLDISHHNNVTSWADVQISCWPHSECLDDFRYQG
jgi:hypothetical protein